jgi:hypothetical protein
MNFLRKGGTVMSLRNLRDPKEVKRFLDEWPNCGWSAQDRIDTLSRILNLYDEWSLNAMGYSKAQLKGYIKAAKR